MSSDWIKTRISQIASLANFNEGGEDTSKIDSNKELGCLANLLANCTTDDDKSFVYAKIQEYLSGSQKCHFEHSDGTSYDEVYDGSGNRMYVGYDKYGNLDNITTTKIENGAEVSDQKIDITYREKKSTEGEPSMYERTKNWLKSFFS